MSCINKPRYYEFIDSQPRDWAISVAKLDVDLIQLQYKVKATGKILFSVDLSVAESTALRMALNNCELVVPLPYIDYDAVTEPGPAYIRLERVQGEPPALPLVPEGGA